MAGKIKKDKSYIIYFAAIVTFIYLVILLIQIGTQISDVNKEIAVVEQAYQQQVAQNEQLSGYIADGKIDEYVEKIARDELGYVKPGEHIYYEVSVSD